MANPRLVTAHAKYDFAVDGGDTGTIVPANSAIIPDNAVITNAYHVTTTALTSGGSATLALTAGGVTLNAAVAFDNADYSDEAVILNEVNDKTTSSTGIQFVIATAALTAGVVDVFVEYYLLAESA
tara:strand:- start:360 stop:737 length:378 start_codon:yes stop_codon:yes gene_type:complete